MKPEQQNIAIAKVCGWTDPVPPTQTGWMHPPNSEVLKSPPDFTSDLNACHEMEKILTDTQYIYFSNWLIGYPKNGFRSISAPAPIRAQAFLRTLGLWQDDPAKSS